jgi:hypothetical protein
MNKMDFTEAKYFASLNQNVSTLIVGDKLKFILWDFDEVIIIQNKQVAETYKEYFNILWEKAKIPTEALDIKA